MSQQAQEGWQTKAQIGVMVFTLLGTFSLSIWGKPAAPFAAVGLGVLLLLRFGDIASITLKGFGAEAAVTRAERAARGADRATEDAREAIESLKQTGMLLSSHVLNLAALQGQDVAPSIRELVAIRDNVVSNLRALGCTQTQIDRLTLEFRANTFANMLLLVTDEATHGAMGGIRKDISDLGSDFDLSAVKAVFAKHRVLDSATERRLEEMFHFRDTDQIDFKKFDLE